MIIDQRIEKQKANSAMADGRISGRCRPSFSTSMSKPSGSEGASPSKGLRVCSDSEVSGPF